jgi:hypothetical protein
MDQNGGWTERLRRKAEHHETGLLRVTSKCQRLAGWHVEKETSDDTVAYTNDRGHEDRRADVRNAGHLPGWCPPSGCALRPLAGPVERGRSARLSHRPARAGCGAGYLQDQSRRHPVPLSPDARPGLAAIREKKGSARRSSGACRLLYPTARSGPSWAVSATPCTGRAFP